MSQGWGTGPTSGWGGDDPFGVQRPAQPALQPPQYAPRPAPQQARPQIPPQAPPEKPSAKSRGRGGLVAAVVITALVVGGLSGVGGAWWGARSVETPVTAPKPVQPGGDPQPKPAGGIPQIAQDVLPSTVTVVMDGGAAGTGSGFVFDDQGHIATNNHVIETSPNGAIDLVFPDGTVTSASVVGRSPSYDLAVVKADDPLPAPPVELGDSDAVQIGETTVAIGSPLGLGGTVTSGIVSSTDRPLSVGNQANADAAAAYINGIQTDAAINPGNSGGPLVNGAGQVIGVNSAILTMSGASTTEQSGNIGVGFAIPINQATQVIDEILETGAATYPVIGASVTDERTGVRIAEITPDGPADIAGIQVGDVVTAVDGHMVPTVTDFIVRVRSHRPGDQVTLSLESGAEKQVTLEGKVG